MPSVCALVVTYNRSKYLQKALEGILNQQQEISGILIYNNNATDNTEEILMKFGYVDSKGDKIKENYLYSTEKDGKHFYYYHNDENLGGAGGFANGIRLISELDYDYVWIMDDDVYPEPNCLSEIMKQMSVQNVQVGIPNRTDENFYDRAIIGFDFDDYHKFWTEMRKTVTYGPFDEEAIKVVDMPFEGPVVEMALLRKVGIPDSGFFIEYDDSDFAQRLQQYSDIIFATKAQLHRQLAVKVDPSEVKKVEPYNWRNYYKIRNNIIFDKRYGKNWKVRQLSPLILIAHHIVIAIRHQHLKHNLPIIWKGFWDGVFQRMGKRVDPNY
ncbi:TPA: glycosyltransferase family 2 protein [Streptococcus pneumoniae]|nr:glycosyltransferase family 2 protein [Streptococcus pneumoniae]HEV6913443.1 glycosyltransferase family 2 protein [Streptococcus pneumoniae]